MHVIAGMAFHTTIERGGAFQRRMVPGGPVEFRQRVDAERLAVDLLVCVAETAVRGDRPKQAALFLVPEPRHEIVKCPPGHLEAGRIPVAAIGSRKRPEDAGGEQRPARRVLVNREVVVDLAIEAAALPVAHVCHPEGEDILP